MQAHPAGVKETACSKQIFWRERALIEVDEFFPGFVFFASPEVLAAIRLV
jgi:hypothetical protein